MRLLGREILRASMSIFLSSLFSSELVALLSLSSLNCSSLEASSFFSWLNSGICFALCIMEREIARFMSSLETVFSLL